MYFQSGHLLQVDNTPVQKNYEMGYTVAEFYKTLHGQFLTKQSLYSCKDLGTAHWDLSLDTDTKKVTINVTQASPRRIAMLSLPILKVSFKFYEFSHLEQEQFLQRFFKYFHKGGG